MKNVLKFKWIVLLSALFVIATTDANAQRGRRPSTRQRSSVTSSSTPKTWTGASTVDELKRKLNGTIWHCNDHGIIRKIHFTNGGIKYYSGRNGEWYDEHFFPSYEVKLNRGTSLNYISVEFGEDTLVYGGFSIAFTNKCMLVVLFQYGSESGILKFGNFEWNDEV